MFNQTTPSSSSSPSPSPLHFLDPEEFLWSFFGCIGGFCVVALRAVVWGTRYCEYHRVNARAYLSEKKTPPSFAPLFLSFLLMVVLALRAIWSVVKYNVLVAGTVVSPQLMAVLDHLPLLFLLSAFSRISLFWVKSFGMEKTNRMSWIIFSFNFLLYVASFSQITLSVWYPEFLDPHNLYYILQLSLIALWCLILSVVFSVYGWRLRQRLGQSIHSSQQVKDTFARILAATILCTGLFLMRGVLFCFLTLRYNVYNIADPKLNRIVYPLLVYTVPDVVSSVCILFIMDVKRDNRGYASDVHHYQYRASSGRFNSGSGGSSRPANFGGVGSIVGFRYYGGSPGEGEVAVDNYLDEQSPTDSSLNKYDWEQSHGYSPPGTTYYN